MTSQSASTTFTPNQSQAVHRWFRYSAGFSATWAAGVIAGERASKRRAIHVLDPFAGVATSLLAAQSAGVASTGVEAHPFVYRVAAAKLCWPSDPSRFLAASDRVVKQAQRSRRSARNVPDLLERIYDETQLVKLLRLRDALDVVETEPEAQLCWLALASILRACSHAGTAPWQYVLPNKHKKKVVDPVHELVAQTKRMAADMAALQNAGARRDGAQIVLGDARSCSGVDDDSVDLVITSPPYPNNYDYADATRVELSFFGDVSRWAELHGVVRKHLVRSCSQHTAKEATRTEDVLGDRRLDPIRDELATACAALAELRTQRAGKKTYDSMVAAYFADMAATFHALSRVTRPKARVCMVIGDSAPYGVYVPVDRWFTRLAESAGFSLLGFEETRQRNLKWKNRKHRVPLREGRLWLARK